MILQKIVNVIIVNASCIEIKNSFASLWYIDLKGVHRPAYRYTSDCWTNASSHNVRTLKYRVLHTHYKIVLHMVNYKANYAHEIWKTRWRVSGFESHANPLAINDQLGLWEPCDQQCNVYNNYRHLFRFLESIVLYSSQNKRAVLTPFIIT